MNHTGENKPEQVNKTARQLIDEILHAFRNGRTVKQVTDAYAPILQKWKDSAITEAVLSKPAIVRPCLCCKGSGKFEVTGQTILTADSVLSIGGINAPCYNCLGTGRVFVIE